MDNSDKIQKLDEHLGQETASLGEIGSSGAGGSAVAVLKARCICCGKLKAKPGFKYCFHCHKCWQKVYDDYIAAGFEDDVAKKRATKAYPPRYDELSGRRQRQP